MSDKRGFFAVAMVPDEYRQSRELGLCLRRLKRQLGDAAVWCSDIAQWRTEVLAKADSGLPLLLIREPGFWGTPGWADALLTVLASDTCCDAVIPADPMLADVTPAPSYFTLRGYESYVQAPPVSVNSSIRTGTAGDAYVVLARAERVRELADLAMVRSDLEPIFSALAAPARVVFASYLQPFFRYFDYGREEMLPLVPDQISRVLDVGCANGAFGALLKTQRNCVVDGVEAVPDAAAAAEKSLDKVYRGDFVQMPLAGGYDLISFLDVLEHFPYPADVLDKARTLLVPGGKLLLSIPNVGFWAIVDDLLAGRWDYVPAGILCETHLRFFTASTIAELLAESGFQIIRTDLQQIPMPEEVAARLGSVGDRESLTSYSFRILAALRD